MTDVLLRCNVTPGVGLGHLMRCRTLADLLTDGGHRAHVIGLPDHMRQNEDDRRFATIVPEPPEWTPQGETARLLGAAKAHGAEHLILDDYRGLPQVQSTLADAGIRWLQQFDASRPFPFVAPLLANMSLFEAGADYRKALSLPDEVKTLFGPAYAVLRAAFTACPAPDPARPPRRVLISFGGGDDHGAVAHAVAATGRCGLEPVVISGAGNPRNRANAALPCEHHIAPPDVPALMASCDIAVLAGGTMSYEAAHLGLPLLLVPLAPNQARACRGWHSRAEAIILPEPARLTADAIHDALTEVRDDDARRIRMARAGHRLVDGQGGPRLLEALLTGGET